MKCSSRRNCNTAPEQDSATFTSLNEVQLPKELQHESWRGEEMGVVPQ